MTGLTEMSTDEIYLEAYERGYTRGRGDKEDGFYNEAPLSGEWAGESIPELLGDLFRDDILEDELCSLYEEGYGNAFLS